MENHREIEKKRIFYYVPQFLGCSWYRCHVPGVELRKQGHIVGLNDVLTPKAIEDLDVIVFQRHSSLEALQHIEHANQLGKTTVCEIDDDLWHIDPTNPSHKYWADKRKLARLETGIRICKIVTTSTPYLAKSLRNLNSRVKVLPNMLPTEHWKVNKRQPKDNRVVVGWAGSLTHWSDLEILKGTIEQILDDYEFVDFIIAGMKEHPFKDHPRIKMLPPVMLEEYANLLVKFDIGIAPLTDTQFNRAKSDLKFIEYAMTGLAVVASKVEPYEKTIRHKENGFLARNSKDWLKYLRELIESPDLRKKIGAAAKDYAETRTIEKNIHLWEETYNIKTLPRLD